MLMLLTKKENKVSLDNFIHELVHLIDLYPNANYSKDEVCVKKINSLILIMGKYYDGKV